MKLAEILFVALAGASLCAAQSAPAGASVPKVRHIIGLGEVKRNATGALTVQNGVLHFQAGKAMGEVPASSIDDIFVGAEVTQGGGKTGRVVKTAAIAAPFESGKALTILLRTKVDILTLAFHDSDGGAHGVIFALPKGQGEPLRAQLVQAGAHVTEAKEPVKTND